MKKKFLKIIIVSIMLMLVYSTIVNALSFTATMTTSHSTVAQSKEFMVTIKVSNLDVGQNGINSLSGYLKYDSAIFEAISDSSIEGLNGWSPIYNASNGKITLTKTSFVKSDEDVFQVTFKTKAGVATGKTGTISYTSIEASNSEQEIRAADISSTITIGTETIPSNTVNTTNTANVARNNQSIVPIINATTNTAKNTIRNTVRNTVNNTVRNTVRNTANNTSNSSVYVNKTNTVSTEDIPYTGTEDTIMYIMIVILALGIIFYIKYQSINKELK